MPNPLVIPTGELSVSKIPPTGVGYHPPMWEEWLGTVVPFAVVLLLILVLLRRRQPQSEPHSTRPPMRLEPLAIQLAEVAPYIPLAVGALAALLTVIGLTDHAPEWTPEWLVFPLMPGAFVAASTDSWVEHNDMTPLKVIGGAATNFVVWWLITRAFVRSAVRPR